MNLEANKRIAEALRNNATSLDLKGLELTVLPDSLFQLTSLCELYLSLNQLTTLPESIRALNRLRALYISHNQLTNLPEFIEDFRELQSLDVSTNQLEFLPNTISRLSKLRILNLSQNALQQLPETIGDLQELQEFNLADNCLSWIPQSINRLIKLKQLVLYGNPALGLPPEVLGIPDACAIGSPKSICDFYFASRQSRPLNEAKMILVGRGGVGKTSLVNQLIWQTFQSGQSKTDGIAITPWPLRIGEDDMRLNVWDFGGQEIMHATHQFFFTKRSLYLLVINAREGEQDGNIEYWLRLVESFGGDSPVIIVINKIKDHQFDLNRRGLKDKFPSIRAFVQTDCEAGVGIEELRQAVIREINNMPHVRDPFPLSWCSIKERLANLHENFISYDQYQRICADHGLDESSSQSTLVGFLHDLGIVVNFREHGRLRDTHVLNPHWVTNGIYKILNDKTLAKRNSGGLSIHELGSLLDPEIYPKAKHQYLLDLMEQFELCYEFYDVRGTYLVPELLTKEEPDIEEIAHPDALRFEYRYGILPQGVMPRFIVRARRLNENLARWRTGVELRFENNRALVKADLEDRRIKIAVVGDSAGRRRLLSIIRRDFEDIHGSIAKLEVKELVPIPGYTDFAMPYQKLRAFEQQGIQECIDYFDGEVVRLDVRKILDGIMESQFRQDQQKRFAAPCPSQPVDVALSYAREDEKLKDNLVDHLKILEHCGLVKLWHDRKIAPGEDWAGVIDAKLKDSRIILLLVSQYFFNSDYCYKVEMPKALERQTYHGAIVIPIILRDCVWQEAPFRKLQALPKDGRPVTAWPNEDSAWADVASGIEVIAKKLRGD